MTPGIDFYRVGNKVKAFYQGFELLGGNSVEVQFKPASGYDLIAVTIDGASYSPSAAGMTCSDGVYTYKITRTPSTASTLVGDTGYRDSVKITKIAATFGIPSYSGGGESGSNSGTSSGTSSSIPYVPVAITDKIDSEAVTEKKEGTAQGTEAATVSKDGTAQGTGIATGDKDGTAQETGAKETGTGSKDNGAKNETGDTDAKGGNVQNKPGEEVSVDARGTKTVKSKIENSDGSSKESIVKTTKEGKVVSETVEISAKGDLSITLKTDKTDGSEVIKSFKDAKDDGIKLSKYKMKGTTAIVPDEITVGDTTYVVTTIGAKAMANNTTIKKVTLPDSITTIGKGAFQNDKNLKKIVLGSGITSVSKEAFKGIAKGARIFIGGSEEDFKRIVALIRASGIDKSVKFRREKE